MKNPLKLTSIVFYALSALYVLIFISKIGTGHTLADIVISEKIKFIGFVLCVLFALFYMLKNILAWWIALLYCPAMAILNLTIGNKSLDIISIFIITVIPLSICHYLEPKYAEYKDFIKGASQPTKTRNSQESDFDFQNNNPSFDLQNPLQIIFVAVVGLAMFSVYNLFTGGGALADKLGVSTVYAYLITELLLVLAFIAFYWKKSILAWWIALISIPLMWLVYYLFQPIKIPQLIFTSLLYGFVVWYLIAKYKPYKEYINQAMAN